MSIYNIKGGVGKTSTTINLAFNAAKAHKVLIWDLDPQGAATFYLEKKVKERDIYNKVQENGIKKEIKQTKYKNIDLIPADLNFKDIDRQLENNRFLKETLESLTKYDYIFLDSPPTLSKISRNIFKASQAVIIPTIPTVLSVRTYNQIIDLFREDLKKKKILTFLSMVDRRKKMHLEITKKILSMPKKQVLRTLIYNSTLVERMGDDLDAVEVFAPYSETAKSFTSLWNEIKLKIS